MTTRANLYVDQGTDFKTELDLFDVDSEPLDVSGYTFKCEVKKVYSSQAVFEAIVYVDEDPAINNLIFSIPAEYTENIEPGKYQYDVIMIDTLNNKIKILEGLIFILSTITR